MYLVLTNRYLHMLTANSEFLCTIVSQQEGNSLSRETLKLKDSGKDAQRKEEVRKQTERWVNNSTKRADGYNGTDSRAHYPLGHQLSTVTEGSDDDDILTSRDRRTPRRVVIAAHVSRGEEYNNARCCSHNTETPNKRG